MTKSELIELTKKDMVIEDIPMYESNGHLPDDIRFEWKVEDLDDVTIQVTMEAWNGEEYVTSKSRKIQLLEG